MRQILRHARRWSLRIRHHYFGDFVFIHINKTAGSSIERALNLPLEHKTALEKRAELGEARWAERFTFTVVRNPWDRVVSLYHYRITTNTTGLADAPLDFTSWVRHTFHDQDPAYFNSPKMLMPQRAWIVDDEGHTLVDFIGRFETLERDFQTICGRLQRSASLPHLKQSNRRPYRDYYDDASIEIVRRWFIADIEHFGYAF